MTRCSPVQELQPSSQTHGHAHGKLIGRRYVGQARLRRSTDTALDVKTFLIDRHGNRLCPSADKRAIGRGIARILNPCPLAFLHQHTNSQIDALLCAGDHDHVVRRTTHAARRAKIFRDRLPKSAVAPPVVK